MHYAIVAELSLALLAMLFLTAAILLRTYHVITTRLAVGAVAFRRDRRFVVLEIDGDRAVLAPLIEAPHSLLRGDVSVDPFDIGLPGSSELDLVVRCGSAKTEPTAGLIPFWSVTDTLLASLRRATIRAAESRQAERPGATGIGARSYELYVGCFGRKVGKQVS